MFICIVFVTDLDAEVLSPKLQPDICSPLSSYDADSL